MPYPLVRHGVRPGWQERYAGSIPAVSTLRRESDGVGEVAFERPPFRRARPERVVELRLDPFLGEGAEDGNPDRDADLSTA
jgi:hypothetical protein